ncbi:MAG: gamma-glutamyltransferase, partial [Phycisphaerales bacterium]
LVASPIVLARQLSPPHAATGREFMVAAAHPLASQAGAEILAAGGNVVDAAVATSLALSVVRPQSSGIGGGGVMGIHRGDRGSFTLDFRETAPASVSAADYLDDAGDVLPMRSTTGVWSIAVPGHVRGMQAALDRFGTMDLAAVLAPAIRLAREGFEVDAILSNAIGEANARVERFIAIDPRAAAIFAPFRATYLVDGRVPLPGEILRQPDQAATLETLAREGAEAFYTGSIATRLIAAIKAGGGPMTAEDLANYQPIWRDPLRATLSGRLAGEAEREVVSMPPPSSGGACLLQALMALDGLPRVGDPEASRRFVEALRHAFADRAALLGDPDATPEVSADIERMLEPIHLDRVRAAILLPPRAKPDRCGLAGLAPDDAGTAASSALPEDGGTSHFCVIDSAGNAVAGTDTVNLGFGSLVIAPGTGFVLNDQMDDFTIRTDVANEFGLFMSRRNLLAGGRRPLSSMSPTIVVEDGRAAFVAGAAGGPRIISATLAVLLAMLEGDAAAAAVAAPRVHHQWMPDRLLVETGVFPSLRELLTLAGHTVREEPEGLAVAQAARRGPDGSLEGASDPRGGGRPAGR